MSPPQTTGKVNQDSKQIGLRFAASIESILRRLRLDRVTVPEKDRERLNKCYAPGHPDYIEYEGEFQSSEVYRSLETLASSLHRNPSQRTFIVDHTDAKCTEDSVWLSLPKWQHDYDLPSIYWHVVTERSIEKSVFRDIFIECDWDIEHEAGPRGTSFVSKYVYADENSGPEDHKIFKRHYGTLFSDQPGIVAQQGLECGEELYSAAARFGTSPKPVVRIFRCAPRTSLVEGISRIMKAQLSDNVFDIWIRHSEAPEKMLGGFGKYEFHVDDTSKSPLELLTSIIASEETADDATVVSIPSPLSSPLSSAMPMKSSMYVSVPKDNPNMGTRASNGTTGVSPLNSTDVHIDSTATPQLTVETVLSPSMSICQKIEEVATPTASVANTPKRGSGRRSNSSHSESDQHEQPAKSESFERTSNVSTPSKDKDSAQQSKKDPKRKTPRKSQPATPVKQGVSEIAPQKSSASSDSGSLSKDEEIPHESDILDEKTEQPTQIGKKPHPRKKRSKKKSKSPTRPQVSPNPSFQEEKKDIEDVSQDLNKVDSSSFSTGVQNTGETENATAKEPQQYLICNSCKKQKSKTDYSKAQLRKKEERRCTDCVQTAHP